MAFEGASFLLQWATGGLLFLWVTTRRREVSIGYGWTIRATFALLALGAAYTGIRIIDGLWIRDLASVGVFVATMVALVSSIQRRKVGVRGQKELAEARSARVAAMTGIDRSAAAKAEDGPEFEPWLDLVAPVIGTIGIIGTALAHGDPVWLAMLRLLVGAAFLGVITDAMLLGHWYLVQPGMARGPLLEQIRWAGIISVPEILLMLVPTGMISVFTGEIDDAYGGLLGWFWIACAVTTVGLVIVTRLALKERAYSAVMAATGLLYLAILTSFGTDLVARALLSGH